jgi:hypothetical protein
MQVSHDVVMKGGDADLIVLEGMGRAIETNLNAAFRVDSLKLGMIKHREVCAFSVTTLNSPYPVGMLLTIKCMLLMCGRTCNQQAQCVLTAANDWQVSNWRRVGIV